MHNEVASWLHLSKWFQKVSSEKVSTLPNFYLKTTSMPNQRNKKPRHGLASHLSRSATNFEGTATTFNSNLFLSARHQLLVRHKVS